MKVTKKKTNGFEYTIFGIDLFIAFVINSIKKLKKINKNKNKYLFF